MFVFFFTCFFFFYTPVSSSSSSSSSAITGGLTFLTFKEGTYDVQLGIYDLVKKTSTSLYTFSSEEFESGFWVETSFITSNSSTSSHSIWVSNVQYDSNQTQGALLEIDLIDQSLRIVNSTYCWSMFLDVRDISGSTILCVADNAMDLSQTRTRKALRNEPLRVQPGVKSSRMGSSSTAYQQVDNSSRAFSDTRDVLIYSINRLTGVESLLGKFAIGFEEDIAITYDTKKNIIYAMLQNDVTNANYLVGFDIVKRIPLPNPAPVSYDKIFYAFQYDSSLDKIVGVASNYDTTVNAWNTAFGSIDPVTAIFTPIGKINGTFAALRQFNDIDCIVPSLEIFFLTCFDWILPDTTLYIIGVSTRTGEIVYKEPIRNPFIDISYVETWKISTERMTTTNTLEDVSGLAAERMTTTTTTTTTTLEDVSGLAAEAFTTQLSFYSFDTGYFGDPKVNDPFWTTANALANAATLAILTSDARVIPVIENSFTLLVPKYATPKDGNDDIQWHAHAWLKAYELTSNSTYLNEVFNIYNELFNPTSPWHGWNDTCGGVNWWSNNAYVNTITNGLAFTGLVSLQRVTKSLVPLQGKPLLDWAQLIWNWADRQGLLNSNGVFLDGFGKDCITPGGSPWSYNSGIWLDGLTGLSIALNNATYSNFAYTLAKNAALFFANSNEDGILREVSCGGIPIGNCTGADGREFKGVFVRHLAYAILDWSSIGTSASNVEAAYWGRQWISKHLDSLLQNDASVLTKEGTITFGQFYQGPFQEDNTLWISHSAGNDIVLAALQVMLGEKVGSRGPLVD